MGAEIANYVTPSKLFRYRSLRRIGRGDREILHRELSAIDQATIWTSPYMAMNDPMEGTFFSRRGFNGDRSGVLTAIRYNKENTGIACFSETPTNELMWAHYADEFRGICVAYDFSELRDGLQEGTFSRLFYTENPPSLDLAEPDMQANVRRVLSSKSQKWAYEREWRLFTTETGRIPYGDPRVVKTIYVGNRMSDENREEIELFGRHARIKISSMVLTGYKVRFDNTDERFEERPRRFR